jgi:hypothetical protein
MDSEVFDRITRVFGSTGTRRTALGALLSAGLLGVASQTDAKTRRRKSRRLRAQAQPGLRDCPHPKPGQNLSKCDFSGQDLRGASLRGANLTGADFTDANLCGADLRATNLSKADFMEANLTRVDLRGTSLSTAKLTGATFCQTRKPDGSLDNSGCPTGATVCCNDAECPAGQFCVDSGCTPCPAGSILLPNGDCAVTCEKPAHCTPARCANFACSRAVSGPKLCDTSPLVRDHCTSQEECPPGTACTIISAPNSFGCFTICTPRTR